MGNNKINNKAFILYLISFILYFASYLIYTLIPSSDLANSIEHSGMDAVYVLTASPVLAVLSLGVFVAFCVLNKNYLENLINKKIFVIAAVIFTFLIAVSVCFSISFVISQYKLGFTAPINDTKWETYSVCMLFVTVIEFVSLVLFVFAMKGKLTKNTK